MQPVETSAAAGPKRAPAAAWSGLRHRAVCLIATLLLALAAAGARAEAPPVDVGGHVVDLGTLPLSLPVSMLSELIRRDQVLAGQLARLGWRYREHGYLKGSDMAAQLAGNGLEAALVGDLPALKAIANHDYYIVALAKASQSSIVARGFLPLTAMAGKRISFAEGSNAYYTLVEALASVKLSEKDIVPVPLDIHEMLAALEGGRIDAFVAWEPLPTQALARHRDFRVAYRGLSNSYLVVSGRLVNTAPEVLRPLLAAVLRAVRWMRAAPANAEQAAAWTLASAERFLGKPPELTVEQVVAITRRELLDVVSAPAIPRQELSDSGRFAAQLRFLKERGQVRPEVDWASVKPRLLGSILEEVVRDPAGLQWQRADYVR